MWTWTGLVYYVLLTVILFQMQCFPLYSVLKAAGMTRLDYLSLDLEATKLEASAKCEKPMLGQEIQALFYRL